MKRKRYESTTISNKILCLQNGSNVEVQLDDGKWHSGIIIQCQLRKYLVQVEQQQYWIDFDLIRPNTIIDHKRNVPFEYRPGQFLRNETKSTSKIVSDEKILSSPPDSSSISSQIESSNELKKKRLPRTTSTNTEQKKSPFVWKPSTNSIIQTRRSSKSNNSLVILPEENIPVDNHCRTRTLSNSTEQKITTSNSVKTSTEIPSSEVLIFRPIIRFVEATDNGEQSNNTTSPTRHCSIDEENVIKQEEDPSTSHPNSKHDDYTESLTNPDLIYHINASTDSRSSSTTSTDNPYIVNQYDSIPSTIEQQIKIEQKSACFLETPPPSLPDIHITQESESSLDKPHQQLKSKRKQNHPQRKQIQINSQEQGQQINGVLNRLLLKQKDNDDNDDLSKPTNDLCDPGYLSDEYSEPISSNNDLLTYKDLENFYHYLEQYQNQTIDQQLNNNLIINQDDKNFYEQFIKFIYNNNDNYEKMNKYRLEYYHNNNNNNNQRLCLISNILQRIFSIFYNKNFIYNLYEFIPNEIKTHMKLCLNHVFNQNINKKKFLTRHKRLTNIGHKHRNIKTKRSSFIHMTNIISNNNNNNENLLINEQQQQQLLLSPSSPLTPISSKISEQQQQQQSIEDLLSPNNNNIINSGVMEQIPVLPKERDVYEVIHCLCNCQIDNGFMIQCEACLCWSHCECVGVTATCIPAFFKCNVCIKAEAERSPQWSFSSILDDEITSLFLNTTNNSEKISLFLSYSRRLWNLREQIIELKLRHTPILRSLQHALRCDDLIELFQCANIKSDQLMAKIEERKKNRKYFECIAQSINHIVDSVCSSISTSSCLSIELTTKNETKINSFNDQMNILISHLSDDDDTRQVRLLIQNRYEQLMSIVDNKIQTILLEHQTIQTQMAFELGIMPNNLSDDYLSYDTHELALRTAIDRLKC
ncbi:unnamed protein product [Rotaria sordida]|uniref:Uncharacterized protein n=1 Tax=Rotaria sordida TaxID=392033 RepID=A0A819EXZ6_9BILA|nr:unnamed protein product [Rotaria sordida]CAF3857389.1 unnamed protein product [Rotaria sordida]